MGGSKLSVSSTGSRTVALCSGKDCRQRSEFTKLRSALSDRCDVVDLKCVGICSGPVVVLDPASKRPIVFSKLRTKQDRRAVVSLAADGGRPSKRLRARIVSSSKRTATIKRVRQVIPRSA